MFRNLQAIGRIRETPTGKKIIALSHYSLAISKSPFAIMRSIISHSALAIRYQAERREAPSAIIHPPFAIKSSDPPSPSGYGETGWVYPRTTQGESLRKFRIAG
jgi:hypothetical protein